MRAGFPAPEIHMDQQVIDLIHKYAGADLPPAYLRALVEYESGGNPRDVNPDSGAAGLLQITRGALRDYNEREATKFDATDLLDPDLNLAIGVALLRRIIDSYRTNHPDSLAPDWRSPRWVSLLTLGWNAGYSEKAGVGAAVRKLEAAGVPPDRITADAVSQLAGRAEGLSRYLAMPSRVAWAKRVTQKFSKAAPSEGGEPQGKPSRKGLAIGAVVVAGTIAGVLVYQHAKKKRRLELREARLAERQERLAKLAGGTPSLPSGITINMPAAAGS